MGYKLADGSLSTDYKVGDKFVVVSGCSTANAGAIVTYVKDDGSDCPYFSGGGFHVQPSIFWGSLRSNKQFTKSDLKDGMRAVHRDKTETIVVGGELWVTKSSNYSKRSVHARCENMSDDLEHESQLRNYDIMKVIDRDGPILFERVEKSQHEIEMDKLQKQIAELQEQANKLKATM